MKKILVVFLVLLVALFGFSTSAGARGGGHGGGHGGGYGVPCLFAGLGLLLGGLFVASQPVAVAPAQCLQIIPRHWEKRWDPYRNQSVWMDIPEQLVPCPPQ